MKIYFFIITLCVLYSFYFYKKIKNGLHMLQLESYKNERYYKWIKNNFSKVINIKEIILIIIPIILILLKKEFVGIILLNIVYLILNIFNKTQKQKKPFVVTNRIKRIYITNIIINLILISFCFIKYNIGIILLGLATVFAYFIVIAVNVINSPIEKSIQNKFYNKAKQKLSEMKNLKVVGITGSFGKTSTKYIVTTILSQKYNVLMTPESYNTTMGVVRTINEKMSSTHNLFVCEMGAKQVGDIKEICDLVKPSFGILTAIGPQHLETFKTIENVAKTKMELIDSLPDDGIAFANYEDENIKKQEISKNKILYGFSKVCDYYAENIEINQRGSEFDVCSKNGDTYHIKTKLLGKHNILNIIAGVAIASKLGLTKEEILLGAKMLKPVPHRLELIQQPNGNIIIDDAYNSNSSGAKMALEVLGNFKDKQRILVTPGIVDLGEHAKKYNKLLGNQATDACDYIILVGEKQAEPILEGILEKGYDREKVYIAQNINDALQKVNEISKNNSVILLENDLPDNYI